MSGYSSRSNKSVSIFPISTRLNLTQHDSDRGSTSVTVTDKVDRELEECER